MAPIIKQMPPFQVQMDPLPDKDLFGANIYYAKKSQNECLAKRIQYPAKESSNQDTRKNECTELDILCKLSHENIVQFLGTYDDGTSNWLFMELCDENNLETYLKKNFLLSISAKVKIMGQITDAIVYLHMRKHPIVHRDIKLQNIFMKTKGNRVVVKVGDFGFSKELISRRTMSTRLYTEYYVAPELLRQEPLYKSSVDIFALGLVFSVILRITSADTSQHIFKPLSVNELKSNEDTAYGLELQQCHKYNQPKPNLVEHTAKDNKHETRLKDLIMDMVEFDPIKRKAIDEVHDEMATIAEGLRYYHYLRDVLDVMETDGNDETTENRERLIDLILEVMNDIERVCEKIPKWLHRRDEAIASIAESLENMHEIKRKTNYARVAGGSVGAVSGAVAITGLALAPFTAGISLGLMGGGIAVGVLAGVSNLGATVHNERIQHSQKEAINLAMENETQYTKDLYNYIEKIQKNSKQISEQIILIREHEHTINSNVSGARTATIANVVHGGARLATSIGNTLHIGIRIGVTTWDDVISLVGKTLGKTATKGLGIGLAGIGIAADIIEIGFVSHSIHNGSFSELGLKLDTEILAKIKEERENMVDFYNEVKK